MSPDRGEYLINDDGYTTIPLEPVPSPDEGR
jgi:hypothetical protein